MSAVSAWELQPEWRMTRAQEAQRGVIERLRAILERDAVETMGADELEIMALQLQLASCNLKTAAVEMRRCEEERRLLVSVREREAMRFEAEQAGSLFHELTKGGQGE